MINILYIVAAILAFCITAIMGKGMIPFLHRLKFGQNIRDEGPKWHKNKQGTPTMGGIMFIIGITVSVVLCLCIMPSLNLTQTPLMNVKLIAGLGMGIAYGVIGFLDDYISVVKKRNLGLTERQKLFLQFGVAIVYLFSVYLAGGNSTTIIPFVGRVDFGIFYYIISAVLIVGLVNAVNFTDGIDGLNTTVCFFSFLGLAVCASMLVCHGASMMAIACAAACLGFLIWNFHPAKVFMGDTGSLFLGAMVAAVAFAIEMPILLLPICIVSWWEIISVVLQVSYFKISGGKRLFKMSPIHHHYEMKGWSEVKICSVFGFLSLLGAVVAIIATLYGV